MIVIILVRERGLEPPRPKAYAPKAYVYTNFTTRANQMANNIVTNNNVYFNYIFKLVYNCNMDSRQPLAEQLRPQSLSDVIGQPEAVEILTKIVASKHPASLILWGPPGTGKTTLARIIAHEFNADFVELSAVNAKRADVDQVIEHARQNWNLQIRTILFIDEIHRFNKAQQDAFLPHVESGLITLIGATTENPSFEVIAPLISRARVIVLHQLSESSLIEILQHAVKLLGNDIKISDESVKLIAQLSHGDARAALGNLEMAATFTNGKIITPKVVAQAAGTKLPRYDKNADSHYDLISAFIKSMRGSDERATLYYLARMIEAGEDPKFIARRMIVFASEDIGLAGNGALGLATSASLALERIGMPEGGIVLSHVALALAKSKKSRESYDAWQQAKLAATTLPNAEVPLNLRNAPTKLMKDLGYNQGYKWVAGFHQTGSYLAPEVDKFYNQLKPNDPSTRPD